MSPWGFVIAAILVAGLALAHSILGERFILIRLFQRELPRLFGDDSFTKQTLRFAWHALTVAWWALAALLVWAPPEAEALIGWVVMACLATTSIITIVISRARHLSWVVEWAAIAAITSALL